MPGAAGEDALMQQVPSSDGVTIAVHDLGGRGPSLLCAHATGFHGHCWEPMARALAGRYHSFAIDYRAHGHSTRPNNGMGWSGMCDDTLAVVDALRLEGSYATGHSMGGAALLLAELHRPGTFKAIALFEPIAVPGGPIERPPDAPNLAEGARRRRAVFPSKQAALENYASKPPLNEVHPDALAAYVEWGFKDLPDGTVTLRCRPDDEADTFEAAPNEPLWERLGEVGCPVLVLSGEVLPFGPSTWAKAMADAMPNGHYEQHDELGHFGPMEAPELIAGRLAAFFTSID
jgi:pimeloyl-ACP methyl ester carboxylesterase